MNIRRNKRKPFIHRGICNKYGKYILKDKSSAPSKVKNHINSSSGWILIIFSHKIDCYVYIALTQLHIPDIDIFVINRHKVTHFCIFRFPVSKPLLTHGCL